MRAKLPWSKREREIVQNPAEKSSPGRLEAGGKLKHSVDEEFAVPFRAEYRRIDDAQSGAAKIFQSCFNFFNGCELSSFVAHNASLANKFPSRFELRFDENDQLSASAFICGPRKGCVQYGR